MRLASTSHRNLADDALFVQRSPSYESLTISSEIKGRIGARALPGMWDSLGATAGIHLSERISQLSERMSKLYYDELPRRFGVRCLHAPGVPRSRSRGVGDCLGAGDLLCTGGADKTDPTWYGRRSKTHQG